MEIHTNVCYVDCGGNSTTYTLSVDNSETYQTDVKLMWKGTRFHSQFPCIPQENEDCTPQEKDLECLTTFWRSFKSPKVYQLLSVQDEKKVYKLKNDGYVEVAGRSMYEIIRNLLRSVPRECGAYSENMQEDIRKALEQFQPDIYRLGYRVSRYLEKDNSKTIPFWQIEVFRRIQGKKFHLYAECFDLQTPAGAQKLIRLLCDKDRKYQLHDLSTCMSISYEEPSGGIGGNYNFTESKRKTLKEDLESHMTEEFLNALQGVLDVSEEELENFELEPEPSLDNAQTENPAQVAVELKKSCCFIL